MVFSKGQEQDGCQGSDIPVKSSDLIKKAGGDGPVPPPVPTHRDMGKPLCDQKEHPPYFLSSTFSKTPLSTMDFHPKGL